MSIRRPAGQSGLPLSAFRISPFGIYLTAGAAIAGAEISVFIETVSPLVGGTVEVPPGAQLTIQSGIDLVNVIGVSSWYLMVPVPRHRLEVIEPPAAKPRASSSRAPKPKASTAKESK